VATAGGAGLVVALGVMGVTMFRSNRGARGVTVMESDVPKEHWTMPPATLLSRPRWSTGRQAAMLALGGYMVVALILLIVKAVQLAGG
jgi:hypothetical protein